MPFLSREAQFAVYLVDPGPDRPGILVLIQEITGLGPEPAAEFLTHFPSLISLCESEAAARNLAGRFRDFDAVAIVRPADAPLAPAPVEEVQLSPAQTTIQRILFVLGLVQVGLALWWAIEGRYASALFGFLLGLYVLIYFGLRLRSR